MVNLSFRLILSCEGLRARGSRSSPEHTDRLLFGLLPPSTSSESEQIQKYTYYVPLKQLLFCGAINFMSPLYLEFKWR